MHALACNSNTRPTCLLIHSCVMILIDYTSSTSMHNIKGLEHSRFIIECPKEWSAEHAFLCNHLKITSGNCTSKGLGGSKFLVLQREHVGQSLVISKILSINLYKFTDRICAAIKHVPVSDCSFKLVHRLSKLGPDQLGKGGRRREVSTPSTPKAFPPPPSPPLPSCMANGTSFLAS